MKITVIYGTSRKKNSSTYNIAQQFIKCLDNQDVITEFYLPTSMPNFCRGCCKCFVDHTECPDYKYLKPIIDSIIDSDLLIFTAPVYVYHVPGQVKAFLDHFGYLWMIHQPRKEMFNKQVLLISTAAGAGTKSTLKDIKDSMNFWGIARTYTFAGNTYSLDWDNVDIKRKEKFQKKIRKLANKINDNSGDVKPCFKVKFLFYLTRFIYKKHGFNEVDVKYWESFGWLDNKRPWKNN